MGGRRSKAQLRDDTNTYSMFKYNIIELKKNIFEGFTFHKKRLVVVSKSNLFLKLNEKTKNVA